MFCTKCGMKLKAEDKFCAKCGTMISKEERPFEPAHHEQAAAAEEAQLSQASAKTAKAEDRESLPLREDKELSAPSFHQATDAPEKAPQRKGTAVKIPNEGNYDSGRAAAHNQPVHAGKEAPELAYAGLFAVSDQADQTKTADQQYYEKRASVHTEDREKHPSQPVSAQQPIQNEYHRVNEGGHQHPAGYSSPNHSDSVQPSRESYDYRNEGNTALNLQKHSSGHFESAPYRPEYSGQANTAHIPPAQHTTGPVNANTQGAELLGAFAGTKRDYYLSSWQKQFSVNWAAFFLTIFWMGYRKMIAPMIITAGIYILLGLGVAASGIYWLTALIVPIMLAASGFLGNRIYLSHAREQLDSIRYSQASREEKQRMAASKGGTSPAGVLIAFGVMIAYMIVSLVLFTFL
ncbi:zinc-ribbon domain-containing protein [Metabacillus sp. 84]|uniref:zinc-ribbon domain-containing protein n=1 Tax=unclassified Metabacillus TaxID=2675274 RepID=UPI003CEE35DB